jgi:hypothetical protein
MQWHLPWPLPHPPYPHGIPLSSLWVPSFYLQRLQVIKLWVSSPSAAFNLLQVFFLLETQDFIPRRTKTTEEPEPRLGKEEQQNYPFSFFYFFL